MDVKHSHSKNDNISESSASTIVSVYGRWVHVRLSTFCILDSKLTSVQIHLSPVDKSTRIDFMQGGYNGLLHLRQKVGVESKILEQDISLVPFYGTILDFSDLQGDGVSIGREIATIVLRRIESLIETVRDRIRASVGSSVKSVVLNHLHERYGKFTKIGFQNFLKDVNWNLLFSGSNCTEDFFTVVCASLSNNPVRAFDLIHDGDTDDIKPLKFGNRFHISSSTIADAKARSLLRLVCGDKLADQFLETGYLSMTNEGYKFIIKPMSWVQCTDPNGKTAELCIHTVGFSVNPVDEVIIAYLNIKHKLKEYLSTAILHRVQPGFQKLPVN